MTTITANSTIGITLSSPSYVNPVVIDPGITMSGSGTAVLATTGEWVVQNYGSITAPGGIILEAGGTVTNAASASITSADRPIGIYGGAGTVVNAGLILVGATHTAVVLRAGGAVTNQVGGTISSPGYNSVYINGGAGTVVNYGSILAPATGRAGRGVELESSGFVTNASSASIVAGYDGISMIGAPGTVDNSGLISGTGTHAAGVYFNTGGLVTNATSGTIAGIEGVGVGGRAGTVINSGTIAGAVAGAVTAIVAGGVRFHDGGSVINIASALITSENYGVQIAGANGTVTNAGLISGTYGVGVELKAGGIVTNQLGGTIGGGLASVQFAANYANLLVVDPGAVFSGLVDGGNTIGATAVSTLELASGVSAGTLTGLGSQYINFVQVTVGAGADWTLAGTNTIASGMTLTDSGTLNVASYLKNSGSFSGEIMLLAEASLANFGGTISNSPGPAVYSSASSVGVTNTGIIMNSGGTASALSLHDGAFVSNSAGAVLQGGGHDGIYIGGAAGTVLNAGLIAATGTTLSSGIALDAGGYVSNAATGTISSNFGAGIYMKGTAGTVLNAGLISAHNGHRGIDLLAGGYVGNSLTSIITATNAVVVYVIGGVGTLINAGYIANSTGTHASVVFETGGRLTNVAAGTITAVGADAPGVVIQGGIGTVVNYGQISGGGTHTALDLDLGGGVTNSTSGRITGAGDGIYVTGGTGTIRNAGLIAGTLGNGVLLNVGGYISNATGGTIDAPESSGIYVKGASGTVLNAGLIENTGTNGSGIHLLTGGFIDNTASGTIKAATYYGVFLNAVGTVFNAGLIESDGTHSVTRPFAGASVIMKSGGTLTDAGTITGTGGTAVSFGGIGSNLMVLDPGYAISGLVIGSASASNTLELAASASAGTVTGLGSEFVHFSSIAFDTGADWFVAGNTTGLSATISGFAPGDTIEVTGITVSGSSYAGGILTLDEAGGGAATLALTGGFTTGDFAVTNVADGADITVACFRAGTHIRTARGEVKVEALHIGDVVAVTVGSGCAPIVWLGQRTVDCRRHPNPQLVWPVCIRADAFGPGRPHRELFLSPDHAVFVDGVLIPVRHLINGSSIVQVPTERVTYYHVELPTHEVLLAEGLPTETYLAAADRTNFAGANTLIALHPDFSSRVWEAEGCAPLVVTGPILDAARRHLSRQPAVERLRVNALHRVTG